MSDLKPCPFCGSSDIRLYSAGNSSRIYCDGCGAKSGIGTDDEVIAAWNRRAEPMPAQQWQPIETLNRPELERVFVLGCNYVRQSGSLSGYNWIAEGFILQGEWVFTLALKDEEEFSPPTHWMPLLKPPEGV